MLRLLLSAFVLAALASVALAQSRPAPSWLMSAQVYLSDENLQKDLKLTPAQKSKANDLARSAALRLVERMADPKKADAIDRVIKKELSDFLKPAQLARLRQVILQHLARTPAGSPALVADVEVVKQLKLDGQQKKKLQAGETPLLDVLSEEQKEAWAELTGKPFATRLQTVLGTPTRAAEGPLTLQYLSSPDVREDLKLSLRQIEQLDDLKRKYQQAVPRTLDARKRQELMDDVERQMRGVLTKEQAKRLDQIDLQVSARTREDGLFRDERVAAKLRLTKAQQQKIDETFAKRREEMGSLFVAAGTPDVIRKKVIAFKAQTRQRLEAVLDETQQKAFEAIVGAPFTAPLRIRRPAASSGANKATQYLYLTGGLYLGAPALHKELKADAALSRKLTSLAEKVRDEQMPVVLSTDETARKDAADANRKAVAALLSAEQNKRFEQVVLNFLYSGAIKSMMRNRLHLYAEVRDGLKLSDEQIKRLDGGAELEKVLDEAQSKKWKQMLGTPFAGSLLPPGGFFNARPPAPVDLLAVESPDVVKELALSDEQQKQIAEARADWQAKAAKAPGSPGESRSRYVQTLAGQTDKAIAKILDGKQNGRLRQIVLQDARKRGEDVLTHAWLADALKIDARQQERMATIRAEAVEVETLLAAEHESFPLPNVEKTRQAIRRNAAKRSEAVLDAEQKDLLTDLLGAPFKGEIVR